LRDAEDSGHKVHQAFKSTSFRAPSETINEIYLSEDEVSILTALDVSGLKRSMKLTRDLFVIGCRTGLRVSDLRRLNFEHIRPGKSSRMFEMEVKKTGQTITVPIHELVEDLIASYGGNLPPSQAEQIMNRNLKILGELAGFNEPHTIFMTVGGQRQKSIHPKYALIKSHTARRSFCTNAFLSGVPTLDIMAISGHGTEANFFKYVKVTRQQHAERIAEHPFFKKKIG
jgi:integrase